MKRLAYLIPLLFLLVSMIPVASVMAYEEGDVQVLYNSGGGVWVEIDPNTPYEFTDSFYIKLILTEGEAVDIWSLVGFDFAVSLELGETVFVGYGISGSGSSKYSGEVVSGMDAPETFTQAADPGGQFYIQSGPLVTTISSTQYIQWEITDDGGLPSTIFYHVEVGGSHDPGNATGPIVFEWGATGFDPDCDDTYQIQETIVASQDIQADDEDGENAAIETGNMYRLEVWGGPWDDGTDPNRYDTAVSFDGVEWTPLTDYFIQSECFDLGDDNPETGTVFFISPGEDFYIRVNDEAGQFGDNSGTMVYSLALVAILTEIECSDQFTWDGEGVPTASYTVGGAMAAGVEITDLEVGSWYVYVTRDGPWYNNGTSERYDMAIKDTTGSWEPISDYEMLECQEDATDPQYTRYYFQAWDESLWTRVNDSDTMWTLNTGSMGVDIYPAEFDRFPDTCEGTYIIGDLVISKNFQGNQSGGVNVGTYDHFNNLPRGGGEGPTEVLRYYVLDTLDGPWLDGDDRLFTTQLNKEMVQWYETIIHPDMDCVAETDKLGHVRAYFDMDKPYEYYIRVNETSSWTDNSGSMRYNLYEAMDGQVVDPEDPPDPDTCDDFYTRGDELGAITFQATNSNGVFVPSITEYNQVYSIVTTGGPWDDGTSPDLYDVAISDDGGVTWYALSEYPGMLCQQTDGANYVEVFLQHVRGRRWKVRVDDTVFTDNSGTMGIHVYGATTEIDPWHTCSDDYNLVEVAVPDNNIAAWFEGGSFIPYIGPSSQYIWAIEITEGPWTDDTTERYTAEINDGSGWVNHNSYGICTEQVGADNEYFRTYFNPSGNSYKLRADDQDDDFFNNSGSFHYRLYRAYSVDPDNPEDPDDPGVPTDWDLSCYTPCTRPGSFFKTLTIDFGTLGSIGFPIPAVDDWLEYGRCAFTKFISWCPEHTAVLKSIPLLIRNKEPFASFYVLSDAGADVQDMLDSYDWYPDSAPSALLTVVSGGGEGESTPWSFIPEQSGPSPWDGGEITYADGGTIPGGGSGNDLDCPSDMKEAAASAFGVSEDSPFMTGYCFTVRTPFILKAYWMWITLSVEIAFIFFFIKYLLSRLRSFL